MLYLLTYLGFCMVLSSVFYLFTFILLKTGNFARDGFKRRSKTDFHVKGSNVNERFL